MNTRRSGRSARTSSATNASAEGSSFPLTDYKNVKLRFSTIATWHKFSGSRFDAYDDLDSVEVGNCEATG